MKGSLARARSFARRAAMQGLYQWHYTAQQPEEIVSQFLGDAKKGDFDIEYFSQLMLAIPDCCGALDGHLQPFLDRPVMQLDPIERAILRIGAYELDTCIDVPLRVVLNEAVELCKTFGAEQSHTYVNGVLDKVARVLRPQGQ